MSGGETTYRACVKCVMDTSWSEIEFDGDGVCNFCRGFEVAMRDAPSQEELAVQLARRIDDMRRRGVGRDYDCVLGLSGGVDSSFLAYKLREWGLRPLAVQFDNGWNTELASMNIESVCRRLDIDLKTYVVDWGEFRKLQVAFLRAGVANVEAPSDHGIFASIYRAAVEERIPYVISGVNNATEFCNPIVTKRESVPSAGYRYSDLSHIRAINRRFGGQRLRSFPQMGPLRRLFLEYTGRVIRFDPLNYMPYRKSEAIAVLEREIGWRPYSGKHHESVFTRFHQCYILPTKFGVDKRRLHLSGLIWSGQQSRSDAVEELSHPPCSAEQLRSDKEFVCKKLSLTEPELDALMKERPKQYYEYPNAKWLFDLIAATMRARKSMKLLVRRAGSRSAPLR